MKNIILYIIVILIWGTTWLAIKLQLCEVPIETSIFYRGVIATASMFTICLFKRISLSFTLKDHLYFFLLGLCLFSVQHIFIYKSVNYMVSGVVSVVFSLASIVNIFNSYIFFRKKPESNVLFGSAIGMFGIGVFFWQELNNLALQYETLVGVGLALVGTYIFSIGNMISRRNHNNAIEILPSMTIAMGYGAFSMFCYLIIRDLPVFMFPHDPIYWGAVLYLVIPGTIIAFLCYLQLIKHIGPEKAGYATVLFPVIALWVSYFVEGYQWTVSDFIGLCLILVGNCFVLGKKRYGINRA